MDKRRILIVANQTAGGEHLREVVLARMADGPCRFTLLVPASPLADQALWTEGQAQSLAEERLGEALDGLRDTGAEVDGVVGDSRPLSAITDVLIERPQDEIVVSTFPIGWSRWLKQDLPHRVHKALGLPVTHVVAIPVGQASS